LVVTLRTDSKGSALAGRRLKLTLAVNDYDHTRDLVNGDAGVEGIDLTCLRLPVEEIFWRFTHYREWEVSELSLAKYCWLRGHGDESLTAIPVFTSRAFRHSAIFVAADGPVDNPAALHGGRIGIPEWTQTATVYMRGILADEFGIGLADVEWIQAGTNQPGRKEGVPVEVPPGVRIRSVSDRTLNEMLLDGELDAVIAAHAPTDFLRRTGRIAQLFSDTRAVERAYFEKTGVFPIMHVIAIQTHVYRENRWIAMNLYKAFEQAKAQSLARVFDINAPRLPIPWAPVTASETWELFGGDPWPYGIEGNRCTLETFLRYAQEQGLSKAPLTADALFAPEVATAYVV